MFGRVQSAAATGPLAWGRTYNCVGCGFAITLLEQDETPACPHCNGTAFTPASMFSHDTTQVGGAPPEDQPKWLPEVREAVGGKGPHLAWDDDGSVTVLPIGEGFTRIGRSMQAEIQLSGPTVSRRHALVHREGDTVTVVDDRSLNGVFVDGKQVDWRQLENGNELELGGFHLHFIA